MDLLTEGRKLAPWHLNVRVTDSIETRDFTDNERLGDPEGFAEVLKDLFPNSLEGRSVLDMACNCGAHLFQAKEAGAGRCVGVDVREQHIRQAEFLLKHRGGEGMEFRVGDLRELSPEEFDVVFFAGVLYHLVDPIEGLRMACERARETIIVLSAAKYAEGDCLIASMLQQVTFPDPMSKHVAANLQIKIERLVGGPEA